MSLMSLMSIMPGRFLVPALAALCIAGLRADHASAHDLQARVTLHPDATVVEAWFSDHSPAQGAKVSIVDASGKEVNSGRTDDKGVCRLPKLGAGRYSAIVELIGHRETIEFEESETGDTLEFASWRLNKTLGLSIGIGGLLGASLMFWLVRRRKAL